MAAPQPPYRLVPLEGSLFSLAGQMFGAQVKAAVEHPEKVIEFAWPEKMERREVINQINAAGRKTLYSIQYRTDADKSLVQIVRGKLRPNGLPGGTRPGADTEAERQRKSRAKRPGARPVTPQFPKAAQERKRS
jgi:hypothetical protein